MSEEQTQHDRGEVAESARGLSDAEIRELWLSEKCPVCDGAKRSRMAFCRTDAEALQPWYRRILSDGPERAEFFAVFYSSLRHLQLHKTRSRRYAPAVGGWTYTGDGELFAAGYRMDSYSSCIGCKARIVWYFRPEGGKIPVNLSDYQPHRTSCENWDEVIRLQEQRRALQASAVGKRKSRRRSR